MKTKNFANNFLSKFCEVGLIFESIKTLSKTYLLDQFFKIFEIGFMLK